MGSSGMGWLYDNWAGMCLYIAVFLFLSLLTFVNRANFLLFLIWLQVPAYMLHQFEEHAWPGGFKDYVNRNIFKKADTDVPLNMKKVFWINIPVVWILMPLCATLSALNPLFGVWIPYMSLLNSALHVIACIGKREYNPGLFVSLFILIPLSAYTIWIFNNAGLLTAWVNIAGILIAVLLHVAIIVFVRPKKETPTG
jgi:hypothetical protein